MSEYTGRGNGPNYIVGCGGVVRICRGHHDKEDKCDYEYATEEETAEYWLAHPKAEPQKQTDASAPNAVVVG